jgi:hypothetical protein
LFGLVRIGSPAGKYGQKDRKHDGHGRSHRGQLTISSGKSGDKSCVGLLLN